jgi:hypothetical protein
MEGNLKTMTIRLPNPTDYDSPESFNHALKVWEVSNLESYVTEMGDIPHQVLHKTGENLDTVKETILSLSNQQRLDLKVWLDRLLSEDNSEWQPRTKREVINRKWIGQTCYQLEKVKCGKPNCSKCPHGPYWYAYTRIAGKVKSRYCGKSIKVSENLM